MRSVKTEIGDYTSKYYKGNFNCTGDELESLEGAPQYVGGDFYCSGNELRSLEGAPQYVGGYFYCNDNNLESLEGAPQYVGGMFYCDKALKQGENLYIIANALLNGYRDNEEYMLEIITQYFT